MAVNYEIKGQLARLLATEDLVVEHKKVSTACFNVHTRVLTLPLWERASNAVYDMLVAHEVGHALYTPDEDWTEQTKIPQSYVNIVEDARIEKLMKRRYAGLGKTFYNGYSELSDQDFFELGDDDLSTYSFPDRVNLWFKIGNFTNVLIERGEEMEIVNLIAEAETFADVLIAAEEMYKLCKKEQNQQQEPVTASFNKDSNNEVETFEDPEQKTEQEPFQETQGQSESSSDQSNVENEKNDGNVDQTGGKHDDPEIKTDQRLKDAIEQLSSMDPFHQENSYIEFPTLKLNTIIASNKDIYNHIDNYWSQYENDDVFKFVDKEYHEFKRSAQKEVNYLVKEFECRKAADSYARATTARTGVLDCSKLHTYKYNEDLFKKVTTLAEGKSHGLIFVLDWSGSMDRVLLDTIKQLFNLVWFCKKVAIPFEVYAFTNEWKRVTYDENNRPVFPQKNCEKEAGKFHVPEDFALMNFFTNKTKSFELEKQMLSIYRIAKFYRTRYDTTYSIPDRLSLSGTPLNEAIISLNEIIPQFQQQNKLQKVHTMILTDGEAHGMNYCAEFERKEKYIGVRGFNPSTCMLRDRKTGNVYTMDRNLDMCVGFTDMLLRYLRNRYPNVSFIGMRVLGSGEAHSFMRRFLRLNQEKMEKLQQNWKKQKSFSIQTEGYHTYFGIGANSLAVDNEFVVSDNASKTEISNAFKKSMSSKKFNKKILNEFVELIA
jgi:hypothetical protein